MGIRRRLKHALLDRVSDETAMALLGWEERRCPWCFSYDAAELEDTYPWDYECQNCLMPFDRHP